MPPAPGPRFPFAPLADALGHPSSGQLALRLGVHRRAVMRARSCGLTTWSADQWAVACGLHPAEVWADW